MHTTNLADFANKLATAISIGSPGAIPMPSQITQDEWVIQWRDEHPYGYILTNIVNAGQPDRINIRLFHPAFGEPIQQEAQIEVCYDCPILAIVGDINRCLIGQIPALASKYDRIRWNKGFSPPEIEWNDYRRNRLHRIWRALASLPAYHRLFVHDIMVPEESGPGGRVCSPVEMEYDINDLSDPQVGYCLGYLTARLDFLEESGELDEMCEDTGTETWPELLDALTDHQYLIVEESLSEKEDEEEE